MRLIEVYTGHNSSVLEPNLAWLRAVWKMQRRFWFAPEDLDLSTLVYALKDWLGLGWFSGLGQAARNRTEQNMKQTHTHTL